jgi:hypothetical protein
MGDTDRGRAHHHGTAQLDDRRLTVKQRRSGTLPGFQVKSLKLRKHWKEEKEVPPAPIGTPLLPSFTSDSQWLRCDRRGGHALALTHFR